MLVRCHCRHRAGAGDRRSRNLERFVTASIARAADHRCFDRFRRLVKAGIIDPTRVVRCALQHAASVAGLMITTEAMVANRPEKASPSGGPPGGSMGDMGY